MSTNLRERAVIPDVAMVGEAVADEAKLVALDVLLDRIEGLLLRDLHFGIGPARNLDDHVEYVLVLVGEQRNVVPWADRRPIGLDVHAVFCEDAKMGLKVETMSPMQPAMSRPIRFGGNDERGSSYRACWPRQCSGLWWKSAGTPLWKKRQCVRVNVVMFRARWRDTETNLRAANCILYNGAARTQPCRQLPARHRLCTHMSTPSPQTRLSLSSLPVEIIRVCFEHAAFSSVAADPSWVAALATTCHDINAWTRPALYHTVAIDERNQSAFFGVIAARDVDFFKCVKSLIVLWAIPPPNIQSHFLACLAHVRTVTTHRRFFQFLSRHPDFAPHDLFWTSDPPDSDVLADNGIRPSFRNLRRLRLFPTQVPHTDWSTLGTISPQLKEICLESPQTLTAGRLNSFMIYLQSVLDLPSIQKVLLRLDVWSTVAWQGLLAVLRDRLKSEERVWISRIISKAESQEEVQMVRLARQLHSAIDPWDEAVPLHSITTQSHIASARREYLRQLRVPNWE